MKFVKSIIDLVVFALTIVICILALGSFLGGVLTPAFHWITYMLGFIALPVILSLFFVALYWVFRKSFVAILPIIVLLINSQYITAVVNFNDKEKPSQKAIRVGTYNVRNFEDNDKNNFLEDISNYVTEQGIDIIAMQEFSKKSNIDDYFTDFKYSTKPTDEGELKTIIYSKYPILYQKSENFEDSSNGYTLADIKIGTKTVRVICVHLQTTSMSVSVRELRLVTHPGSESKDETMAAANTIAKRLFQNAIKRNAQFKVIEKYIDTSLPVILLGDFNDQPSSNIYFKTLETGLIDGFKSAGDGYMYTFNRFMNTLRIDYIFHSKGIKVYDYFSEKLPYSDHNPVIMDFLVKD